MANNQPTPARPQPRRGPSGAWNRLKPVTIDPLDVYGLPSKGETRLHEHKTQEAYYSKIVERYMKFCASSGGGEELEAAFTSLSLNSRERATYPLPDARPPLPPRPETDQPTDLPHILIAMRKLREGILGSRRHDHFAQRAYMFIIQASILTRQWESYQAPLLHLLHGIHPHTPLSASELRDFVGYRILDLACRQNDLVEAFAVQRSFGHNDRKTAALLKALAHDDWPRFWRIRRAVDGYQRALMESAEERVRIHALKCLGRSYMSADKAFVERSADAKWEVMVKNGVGWQLQESGTVIIRKPKPK